MSAQSLPYPAPSARDLEAQDRTDEAIAFRAKQIADQIRADILVPITEAFLADCPQAQRAGLERRKMRVYDAWDWFLDALAGLGEQERVLMQKRIGAKYGGALAESLESLQSHAIDAYAAHVAPDEVEAAAKEAARDCDRCEYQ